MMRRLLYLEVGTGAQPIVSKVSRDPTMHRDAELKPTSIDKTQARYALHYRVLIIWNAQQIIKK